jgi:hypothetical protein
MRRAGVGPTGLSRRTDPMDFDEDSVADPIRLAVMEVVVGRRASERGLGWQGTSSAGPAQPSREAGQARRRVRLPGARNPPECGSPP